MSVIPYIDLAELLDEAGFPGGVPQANGIAIVAAESGRDPAAKHVNADGSIDRGLWQLNDKWHPDVTDECAYDATCSTKEALRISDNGADFSPWNTYTSGAYKDHLEAARVALDGWARVKKLNAQLAAVQQQLASAQSQLTSEAEQVADLQTQVTTLQGKIDAAKQALA